MGSRRLKKLVASCPGQTIDVDQVYARHLNVAMSSRVSTSQSRPQDDNSPNSTSSTFSSASQPSNCPTSLSSQEGSVSDTVSNKGQASQSATGNPENQPQSASFNVQCQDNVTVAAKRHLIERPSIREKPSSSSSTLQSSSLQHSPSKRNRSSRQVTTAAGITRSPALKRAPASRSSHGIETSTGPPPALSTQRSYTTDTTPILNLPGEFSRPTARVIRPEPPDLSTRPSTSSGVPDQHIMFNRRSSRMSMQDDDEDRTLTLKDTETEQEGDDTISSQEDIFLNLAKQDTAKPSISELPKGRRRSIIDPGTRKQSGTSTSRPHSSGKLFPNESSRTDQHSSPRWQSFRRDLRTDSTPFSHNNSPRDRTYAASAHPLEQGLRHGRASFEPKTSFVPRTRRGSEQGDSPALPSYYDGGRPGRFQEPSNGLYNSSPLTHYATINARRSNRVSNSFDANETGSTISTNAPSVWDELNDMKARIEDIQASQPMMPQSSQQAINNSVFSQQQRRPHTASTTMTTISSSPKHKLAKNNQKSDPSPESSLLAGSIDPNIHPLLHTALANANAVVPSDTYRYLESSVTDALRLVILTRDIKNPSPSDRQIRRKANNLCRSLTELCISLSDQKSNGHQVGGTSSSSRPGSMAGVTTAGSTYHSATSSPTLKPTLESIQDNDLSRQSSRVMSRIEARRSSLQAMSGNLNNGSGASMYRKGSSPLESLTPTQPTPSLTSASSMIRNSSRPKQQNLQAQREEQKQPPSRATSLLFHRRTRLTNDTDANDNTSDNASTTASSLLPRSNTTSSRLTTARGRTLNLASQDRNHSDRPSSREYTSSSHPPLPRLPTSSHRYQVQGQDMSPDIRSPPEHTSTTRRSYFPAAGTTANYPRSSELKDVSNSNGNGRGSSPITPVSSGMIAGQVRKSFLERSSAEKGTQQQQQQHQRQTKSRFLDNDDTSSMISSSVDHRQNNNNDTASAVGAVGRRERYSLAAQQAQAQQQHQVQGQYPSSGSRILLGANTRRRSALQQQQQQQQQQHGE